MLVSLASSFATSPTLFQPRCIFLAPRRLRALAYRWAFAHALSQEHSVPRPGWLRLLYFS